MRRPNLSGAFGIAHPPPSPSVLAHPDRVIRYFHFQRIAWAVRIGAIAAVLFLLYSAHLFRL